MASSTVQQISRLSKISQLIAQKKTDFDNFQQSLAQARNAGAVVAGEVWLQAQLGELFSQVQEQIKALESAATLDKSKAILDMVETQLGNVLWNVANGASQTLTQKQKTQEALQKEYQSWIEENGILLREAEDHLDKALEAKAAVERERQLITRLRAINDRARTSLKEQDLGRLEESIRQWHDASGSKQLCTNIVKKTAEVGTFAHTTELYIMQSKLSNQDSEYTVLLRPPEMDNRSDLNIRGVSSVLASDRQSLVDMTQRISQAINKGLARSFETNRQAEAAPDTGSANVSETPQTELREFDPIEILSEQRAESALNISNLPANDLIRILGTLMYRLVLPESMLEYFERNTQLPSINITTNDLELPWELMHYNNRFLCLERPIARMPMGSSFRYFDKAPRDSIRRFLLIYADPDENLPLAQNEILRIQKRLQDEWGEHVVIDTLLGKQASSALLNNALIEDYYDIIHYAGHARFDKSNPELSSLLLHGHEPFYAQKIRRLTAGRPLIFLNACESGQTANEEEAQQTIFEHGLKTQAEGLAAAAVYGGAVGCIGSIWPVYDDAAADFAVQFYNHLIEGHMIGEAMRKARIFIRQQYPEQVTWASFVLYANPTFQFRPIT